LKSSILELNQNKKISGRTYVKWVVLEIHNDITQYNKNGITWKEQYVQNNLDSLKGMPLCVEFFSDWEKDEPYGHGMTDIKDGVPLFENSVVVGVTENGYIDSIDVNGENRRVLIAEGYIYNQRYPKFVQWLKSKMFDGDFPETSVEICAKEGNDLIIYEDGWKETGRVPKVFDFSGDAILGIEPADDSAVFLELNNKVKEDDKMKETVVELNNKIDEQRTEINTLNDEVKAKDSAITELNGKLEVKQTEINSTIEELKEVNAKLGGKEKEVEELNSKKVELETELNELRQFKQKIEDQKLVGELNQKLVTYSEEEKSVAKEKIETFNKEPKAELMKEIISEINSAIAQKIVEERTKNAKNETNSKVDDIYSDVYEVNNENQTTIDELY
jgi:predicted  nucleic acid-binding Zn-ribbon protein